MSRTTWTLARQAEVRHALANGRTFADIADKMGITWQAVAQGATVYSLRPVCRKGSWTPERIAKLKELWAGGRSASEIARELGETSRNAVIGKIHRLGLSDLGRSPAACPATSLRVAKPRPEKVARTKIFKPPPLPKPETQKTITLADRLAAMTPGPFARPWIERERGQCAWPHGERGEILSCCAPCGDNTYCQAHRELAFRKDYNPLNAKRQTFLATYEQRRASNPYTGPIRSWEAA